MGRRAGSHLESRGAVPEPHLGFGLLSLGSEQCCGSPASPPGSSPCLLLFSPVFGVEPDLTREGGSIPVTLTFQEATGKNVMLLPVGSADDGAHSQNEKLNR